MSYRRRTIPSPIGALTLVAGDAGLAAVLWPDDDPARVPLAAAARDDGGDDPVLGEAADQLSDYFAARRTAFALPLDFTGTPFQNLVWRALCSIPHGQTCSYADIARRIGRPTATRAVGAANGRNPLSIVAPCHRVVGVDGSLTGFAGGLDAKRWLLAHEGALPA